MTDMIREILGSPAGSGSFVLGVMMLVAWGVHYVTKFATRITVRHDQFGARMDKTEATIDEIRRDIAYIKGSLDNVAAREPTIRRKSPVSLTEHGARIAETYDLGAVVAGNWPRIDAALKDLGSRNPYDIQEYCLETAFTEPTKFFSGGDVERLKIISYRARTHPLSVAHVLGVLIRDRYFGENGIAVDEVDQYNPGVANKP